MSEKKYGDPEFGCTLAELKAYAPRIATADGLRIEGPNHKVTAMFAAAGALGDLVSAVEAMRAERDTLRAEVEALRGLLDRTVTEVGRTITPELRADIDAAMAAKEGV